MEAGYLGQLEQPERKKKGGSTGLGIGSSSILVIFVLLCLTTFATLSMVSANADLGLTEKAAEATRDYYAADAEAERILAEIDRVLLRQQADGLVGAEYLEACMSALSREIPGVETLRGPASAREDDGSYLVRYSVPLGERQELSVVLTLQSTGGDNRFLRSEWQVVPLYEWEPESEGLDLWHGDADETFFLGDGTAPID